MTNSAGANLNSRAAVGPQGEGEESPSRFPAYPTYKDLSVGWVDTLPSHWEKVALKWVSKIFAGGTPDKTKTHYWENGSIPWLNSGAVNQVLISEPSAFITTEAFNSSSARWIPSGSLVIALAGQGKTKGMVAQLAIRTTCNQSMAAITPAGNVKPRYLFWWLSDNYQNIRNMAGGDLRDGLNLELIGDIPTLIPSEQEQTQIARFLDHETARIDTLIEEQQRLIELLKEKRQSVISHAVTKGLDPTVPMKDSGAEWLGDVPAHWDVIRSKFIFKLVSGYAFKSEFFQKNGDGEKVLITPGSFDEFGRLYFNEKSTVHYKGEWQAQFELKVGDLVMVLTDLSYKKLILGRAAFVDRGDALLNQRIAKVLNTSRVNGNFLWLGINSEVMREQLKLTASGATVFHTSPEKVGDCWMALPPCEEQLEITAFVEKFQLKLETLIQQVRDTVTLLGERRSALISAAVTGKIDVRGWQPPASAPSPELAREVV